MDLLLFFTMIVSFLAAVIIIWNANTTLPSLIFLLMLLTMSTCTHFERKAVQHCETQLKKYEIQKR